jgi:hypothetical protein
MAVFELLTGAIRVHHEHSIEVGYRAIEILGIASKNAACLESASEIEALLGWSRRRVQAAIAAFESFRVKLQALRSSE